MATSMTGKEALSYCTSCKMDLNHVVVAMQGDRIARVQCKTCKKEHAYKAPKGVTDPAKGKAAAAAKREKKAAEKESAPVELEWEKLMAQHKNAPVRSYGTKTQFALGDRLSHPTFGEGIVNKLIYPNKCEVIFRTDVKVLIHGGSAV
jgi:hypothetical protein